MYALFFAVLAVTPAPNGVTFTIDKDRMEVVGVVKEPFDPLIPACLYVAGKEVGWVWKKTFKEFGVKQLNVCRSTKDQTVYVCPPSSVWMNRTK